LLAGEALNPRFALLAVGKFGAGLDKLRSMHKIAFTDIISWTLNLSGETLTGRRISRAILAGLKIGADASRNFSN